MGLEEELEYSEELPSRGSGWAGWSTSTRSSADKGRASNQGKQTSGNTYLTGPNYNCFMTPSNIQ